MELKSLILTLKEHTERVSQSEEYRELLANIPSLKGRTPFDTLTSVPDFTLCEYPDLLNYKKFYKEKYKSALSYFSISSLEDLIPKFDLNISSSENSVNEVYGDLSDEDSDKFMYALEFSLSLFNEKYKDLVGKVDFVIENRNAAYPGFEGAKEVKIAFNKDVKTLSSFISHEFAHLIEASNPSLKLISAEFLKKRVYQEDTVILSDFCEENGLNYSGAAKQIEVFPGSFIDPYVGRTYVHDNTEVFSIGVQALILDPVNFLFKDAEHFELTWNFLKGLY